MDLAQLYSAAGGALVGVVATFLLERLYQRRAQLEAAKFEVLKIIRDDLDTLERMILCNSEKDKNLRYPRARRIVRASRMLNLNTVSIEAESLIDSLKDDNRDRQLIIERFDKLNEAVSDEYKKHLPKK